MKLVRIAASNLEGQTFDEALAELTFFVGKNFAGKTTRLNAIRLLLAGCIPSVGKLPRETFKRFASGTSMSVEGEFENGLVIRRRWWAEGDSVKTEYTIPAGFEPQHFAVLLDPQEYFGLTAGERVKYVFSRIPLGDKFTENEIYARVDTAAGGTEDNEKVPGVHFVKGGTVQEYVDRALPKLDAWRKQVRASAETMEKTIQGLVQLQAQDPVTNYNLSGIEAQIRETAKELDVLNAEKGGVMTEYNRQRKTVERRRALETELAKEAGVAAGLAERKGKVASLEACAKEAPTADQIDAALHERNNAELAGRAAATDIANAETEMQKLDKEMAGIEDAKSCPFCGASGESWKFLRLEQIAQDHAKAHERWIAAKAARDAHANAYRLAKANHTNLVANASTEANRLHALALAQRDVQLFEERLNAFEVIRAEYKTLPLEDAELNAKVDEIQGRINAVSDKLRGLDVKRKTAEAKVSEAKRLAESQKEAEAARAEEETAKLAIAELKKIQAEMVEAAVSPLIVRANKVFADLMKSPLAFHDGEIGRWEGGTWVSHVTFSGAERLMTYNIVAATLASLAPCKIILTDEMGALHDELVYQFVANVQNAIKAGFIDQLVGTEPHRPQVYADFGAKVYVL